MQKLKAGAPISLITLLLLGALVLSLLAACGGGSDDEDTDVADSTTPAEVSEPEATVPAVEPEETPPPAETETPVAEPEPTIGELFLTVTSPEDETVITTEQITVTGKTLPTAIVSVNGILTDVKADGTFSSPMTLEVGPNDIQVVASTIGEDEIGKVLVLVYLPQ